MGAKKTVLDSFGDNIWEVMEENCRKSMSGPLRKNLLQLCSEGFNEHPFTTAKKEYAHAYFDGFLNGMTLAMCMIQNGDLEIPVVDKDI